jgi:TonB-dependent receptor
MRGSFSGTLFSLSAFGVLGAAVASAHEPSRAIESLEEVVVVGQRLGQQRSINHKRTAEHFVEAVFADNIGRLPDRNVAEALDGLPGVSLSLDHGEGRFVAIRGLNSSLNNFTINGSSAGSPEVEGGGRRVPLDVIGGELLTAVEVVKVQTPDMDAQGIGGTINVITAGPFDHAQQPGAFMSLQMGHDELNDERPYAGEFTIARVDAGGTYGWLLGAAHSYRRSETRGVYQDDWSVATVADGTSAVVPDNTKSGQYDLERRRTGVNAAFEWRPDAGDRYYLRGFLGKFDETEIRQRFEYFFRDDPQTITRTSGTSSGNHHEQDLRFENKDKHFLSISIGGENELDRLWRVDYAAQINDNEQAAPNRNWEWSGVSSGTDSWRIDASGLVDVTAGAVDSLDPAGFTFLRLRTRDNLTQERSYSANINLQRSLAREESYLKLGLKYRRTDRENDASQSTYAPGAIDWTLADFGHFSRISAANIAGMRRPNIMVDLDAANAFFDANVRGTDYFEFQEEETFAAQFQSDYEIDEQVLAAYIMASWDLGPWSVLAGVRAERTRVRSTGFELDLAIPRAQLASAEGTDMSVLPSVITRFDLTDALVLRAAWTHTLGRPNYEQLAPISVLERDGDRGFLQIGNPELKARYSTNYDLALEWYFARGALLSAAVFRKQIDDEIVSRFRTSENFLFNGETFAQFTIGTTENAERSAVNGLELNYQQQFDFLPTPFDGFGIALSYAALDSRTRVAARNDRLPLFRQPDWTRSGSLFYQKAGFEFAMALSKADSFLTEISDAPETDVYAGKYGRLDLRASYTFGARYGLFVEWRNVNDEPAIEYQGNIARQKTLYELYGQTWYIGLTARL